MRVAFQMDPLSNIAVAGDSTFALMLECQARGHSVYYYPPEALVLDDGIAYVYAAPVEVFDRTIDYFALQDFATVPLADFDAVFLRQDPPFDLKYITSTHILEQAAKKTVIINDPAGVRNSPEKIFVTEFAGLTPPTLITSSKAKAEVFREQHQDVILKPLYGNGGAAVFHISPEDKNFSALVEMFQTTFSEPFIIQKYLPDVRLGDKRVILVDGHPVGAVNRVPPSHDARSNLHVGGRPEATELTARDMEICERIGPALRERGIVFAGIDIIGDYLTEINVTSPTGLREIARLGGPNIAALIWDAVEKRVHARAAR